MPLPSFVALCAGIFAAAFGYASIMPLLPEVLGPLLKQGGGFALSWHAGAFAGVYMLALVLFSPLFGAASDRFGTKSILLLGLAGSALAAALLALADGLWSAYAGRAAQGVFAAAVMPVAASALADIRSTAERARKMAGLGSASLLGFFAAPAFGAAIISSGRVASVPAAFYASAVASSAALILTIWVFAPRHREHRDTDIVRTRGLPGRFLWLNLLAYLGLGAFEVALPLAARGPLGVDPAQVSLLFVECSLMMLAVQAGLMWAAPYRAYFDKVLIASVAAYGAGLLWLAGTGSFGAALAAVGLIAAGSGLVLPLIGFLATLEIEGGTGSALGRLTAAGGLGQAVGSLLGGALYGYAGMWTFTATAFVVALGAWLASPSCTPSALGGTGRCRVP